MDPLPQEKREEELDPNTVSPRSLAFLGDAVYELKIRFYVLKNYNGKVGDVDALAKDLVSARAQAAISDDLLDFFSEEEYKIFKRGRNVRSVSPPHSCSISEYRRATGLEALLGYLYIQGKEKRIDEIMQQAEKIYEERK